MNEQPSRYATTDTDRSYALQLIEFVIPRAGNNRSLARDAADLFAEHRIRSVRHALAEHKRIEASAAFKTQVEPAVEGEPAEPPIELGTRVRCTVTGYQGTVTGIRAFLHGSTQMFVDDGRRAAWIERNRLESREPTREPTARED